MPAGKGVQAEAARAKALRQKHACAFNRPGGGWARVALQVIVRTRFVSREAKSRGGTWSDVLRDHLRSAWRSGVETGRDHSEGGAGVATCWAHCGSPGQTEEVCPRLTRFLSNHKLGGLKL